jgi:hypothetical protein
MDSQNFTLHSDGTISGGGDEYDSSDCHWISSEEEIEVWDYPIDEDNHQEIANYLNVMTDREMGPNWSSQEDELPPFDFTVQQEDVVEWEMPPRDLPEDYHEPDMGAPAPPIYRTQRMRIVAPRRMARPTRKTELEELFEGIGVFRDWNDSVLRLVVGDFKGKSIVAK